MADTNEAVSDTAEAPEPAPSVQLIVSFKDGTPPETMRASCDVVGATFVRSMGWTPAMVVTLPAGMSAEQGISRFRALPGVVNVEVDRVVRVKPVHGPTLGK